MTSGWDINIKKHVVCFQTAQSAYAEECFIRNDLHYEIREANLDTETSPKITQCKKKSTQNGNK